jgi:hypothetical protein
MAATTGHSINTGPYGENTEIYSSLKLLHWLNLNCINHWKVLYKLCVFYVDRNSKMTTTAGHSFYIGPIGSFYNQVNDAGSWEPLVLKRLLDWKAKVLIVFFFSQYFTTSYRWCVLSIHKLFKTTKLSCNLGSFENRIISPWDEYINIVKVSFRLEGSSILDNILMMYHKTNKT